MDPAVAPPAPQIDVSSLTVHTVYQYQCGEAMTWQLRIAPLWCCSIARLLNGMFGVEWCVWGNIAYVFTVLWAKICSSVATESTVCTAKQVVGHVKFVVCARMSAAI